MNAINFVIRTPVGAVEHGFVGGSDRAFLIEAGSGNDISLNVAQSDLRGYDRAANDLLITLADGRVIVLEGYFDAAGTAGASRFFVSSNGVLNEVGFIEAEGGALFAQYGPGETWGKWSSPGRPDLCRRADGLGGCALYRRRGRGQHAGARAAGRGGAWGRRHGRRCRRCRRRCPAAGARRR
ncbi:BapA/Bap/LapF family prefix-like domain-containing protein [Ponticoccus litoralis]|uniref:Biofilm-associated protein BapA-like prefix-like domain-containing protein n=1 Tax=Ponticoccus litoralis TaxID=422297 RepID=A0AAW9SSF6_9RHOB